jgi:hypothetical protein
LVLEVQQQAQVVHLLLRLLLLLVLVAQMVQWQQQLQQQLLLPLLAVEKMLPCRLLLMQQQQQQQQVGAMPSSRRLGRMCLEGPQRLQSLAADSSQQRGQGRVVLGPTKCVCHAQSRRCSS